MENTEDHGRIMQSTMNKRPDGTIEVRVVNEDGYSPSIPIQEETPPIEGELILSESSVQPDGSTSNFEQFEGGRTRSFVQEQDGTIVEDHEGETPSEESAQEEQEQPEQEEHEQEEPEHEEPEHEGPEHDD